MSSPYKTVAFQTLGCKLNFSETSMIAQEFYNKGYAKVEKHDIADIYIINTCSVTENADKKAKKAIRQALKRSPDAKIAVIGCYAQLHPEELSSIPGVSIVLGAEEKFSLVEKVESLKNNSDTIILNSDINSVAKFEPAYSHDERTRSFLKIQDGCNYNCSFCTIPLARGKSRSDNILNTIQRAKKIASSNIREIVLTGVNIGDFGVGYGESFLDLIKALDLIENIDRYRISSIEPNLLSDDIINFTLRSQKFVPHFHIPLQSGSNKILKSMRRRYRSELYTERINKIKMLCPNACIGADVIVGFPGETEFEFEKTIDLLDKLDVSYLHVFPYSERVNTPALNMSNKVSNCDIINRSKILHHLSLKKKKIFYEENVGSIKKVLIENYDHKSISGHSENYIPVKIKGDSKDLNKIISVELLSIEDNYVVGRRQ